MTRIAQVRVLVLLLVVGLTPAASHAQAPLPAAKPATPAAAAEAAQARVALDVLKDPAKRTQLITVLEAIAKTGVVPAPLPAPSATPVAAPAPAPDNIAAIPLAPNSLGAQLLIGVPDRLAKLSQRFAQTFDAATDFPMLWLWLTQLATDPGVHTQLYETGWRLGVVLGLALAAEFLLRLALRRPIAAIASRVPRRSAPKQEAEALAAAEAGDDEAYEFKPAENAHPRATWRQRSWAFCCVLPYAIAAELLDLLPLLAILGLSNGVLNVAIDASAVTSLVIQAAVNGYITWRVVVGLVRLLLSPGAPSLRLVPVDDVAARHLLRWAGRIAAIGIAGNGVADVGVFFGLYTLAHDALVKLVWLIIVLCLSAVVLEYRSPVATALRPRLPRANRALGLVDQIRRRIAPVWDVLVIVALLALWMVSALEIKGGNLWLLRAFASTATILLLAELLARLAVTQATGLLARGRSKTAFHTRVQAYEPALLTLVKIGCGVLTAIALAEVWGIAALSWFARGELGARLLASLVSIGFTVAIGVGVWEIVNAAVDRHQARLSASEQAARAARLRTLLPMLRATLMVSIVTMVVLIVLSEIGVNIAPLLAGAGVIGLAIGFGSQKLVQDIITGLFLLLENAMQVGDVVTLGGQTGTVENLSVRTIRLRSLDGSIHIVPFSAVTAVTNMSRDFGFAVVDVSVGLNEDTDHIGELLRAIATDMRADDAWKSAILADLDVLGVEKFLAAAVVIRVRLRTTPGQRWAIGRELNRRIKQRFDELKIESPMTSYRALGLQTPHPDATLAALIQTQPSG